MLNLKRIRLDPDGLITQDAYGYLRRIPLTDSMILRIMQMKNPVQEMKSILNPNGEIEDFFSADGKLDARLDIVDEEIDCLNRPIRIYYNIEPRCNLSCAFCTHEISNSDSNRNSIDQEYLLFQQFYEANVFQVQLTGGEIGIKGYDLVESVKRANEFGFAIILATSGVWNCIDNKVQFIKQLSEIGNIVQVVVSIEGTPEYHDSLRGKGTYQEIVDTVRIMADHGLRPRINQIVLKDSCHPKHLDHLVDLAERFNGGLHLIPLKPIGKASSLEEKIPPHLHLYYYSQYAIQLRKQTKIPIKIYFDYLDPDRTEPDDLIDYRQRYDLRSPSSCGAPLIGVHIDHKGNVFPCGFVQDIPDFFAGQITPKRHLIDIWKNSEVLNRLRGIGKSNNCKSCKNYGQGCHGGCWVMGWIDTGQLNGRDPYCFKDIINS